MAVEKRFPFIEIQYACSHKFYGLIQKSLIILLFTIGNLRRTLKLCRQRQSEVFNV